MRQHNQTPNNMPLTKTPNNQIGGMMSIQPAASMKNTNNISMIANKNILKQASARRKNNKGSKADKKAEKEQFWQWDMLAKTSLSRGKRSSILDLSGVIPVSGNRTTLLKKNSVNVPNYRSSSKNKNCMSNRAKLREMRTSEQNSVAANYIKGNPMSFHLQNDKNDSRCCISAIGMHTHYLNNSIGDSEELIEFTNRNNLKKQLITQKYNSGRFQYSSQEGNQNYSSLSNADFQDEKSSTRQKNRMSAGSYHQHRKGKSKTSKGYYKSGNDKNELKNGSKSKKRKASKKNKGNKNYDNAHTPISRTKFSKVQNLNEFNTDCEGMTKKKRRKTQGGEVSKHQKNVSDNSIMYTSQS